MREQEVGCSMGRSSSAFEDQRIRQAKKGRDLDKLGGKVGCSYVKLL